MNISELTSKDIWGRRNKQINTPKLRITSQELVLTATPNSTQLRDTVNNMICNCIFTHFDFCIVIEVRVKFSIWR